MEGLVARRKLDEGGWENGRFEKAKDEGLDVLPPRIGKGWGEPKYCSEEHVVEQQGADALVWRAGDRLILVNKALVRGRRRRQDLSLVEDGYAALEASREFHGL
jgi:hypothetical protein